jgi:NADH-quinone oxidoreductase subunit L
VSVMQWKVSFPLSTTIAFASFGWTLLSIALGWWLFTKKKVKIRAEKYTLDHAYEVAVLNPVLRASDSAAWFDKKGIDGAVHLFAYTQVGIAKIAGYFDRYIVDGSVTAVTWIARATGNLLRQTGEGRIQSYLLWSAVVLIIFIFWILK